MKSLLHIFFLLLVIITLNHTAYAQWSTNPNVNNPICTIADDQTDPSIISDDSGGAIIVWTDYRGGNSDIYAQRIDSSGIVRWTADGVAISAAANDQSYPTIVNDGSGGAIITWQVNSSSNDYNIYVQRINANGTVQWTVNGVAICTAGHHQQDPKIISDGSGGDIITWEDQRSGTNYDIYAQRIDISGLVQWAGDGVAISTATYDQIFPTLVGDSNGGAIITWQDYRVAYPDSVDIYAQQVNANGILGVVSSIVQEPGSEVDFILLQNYPNPFNPSTKIRFTISDLRFTILKVYDVLGNEVATLVSEYKPAGKYEVEFNSVGTSRDLSLPSGIYFYQLKAGNYLEIKKMVLIK